MRIKSFYNLSLKLTININLFLILSKDTIWKSFKLPVLIVELAAI